MSEDKMREEFEVWSSRLRYDERSGELIWKPQGLSHWDTRYAGKPAGFTKRDKNSGKLYRVITVKGLKNMAFCHRVAFLLKVGRWPFEIDHIDGDGTNNQWINLREVPRELNSRNYSLRSDNKSGIPGVYIRGGRYRVIVKDSGRSVGVGTFDTIFEAACAKKSYESRNSYHVNHGRRSSISGRAAIEAEGVRVEP